uniref:Uncharacterized protein n=1 Tax=Pristionchus pacificus TaxID=54126 RepID=A0A2A6B361_PRIPA|eukprot:PDM60298.1 hypothetical protein PRIPAC_54123 [Pristionchus pacificus]
MVATDKEIKDHHAPVDNHNRSMARGPPRWWHSLGHISIRCVQTVLNVEISKVEEEEEKSGMTSPLDRRVADRCTAALINEIDETQLTKFTALQT